MECAIVKLVGTIVVVAVVGSCFNIRIIQKQQVLIIAGTAGCEVVFVSV